MFFRKQLPSKVTGSGEFYCPHCHNFTGYEARQPVRAAMRVFLVPVGEVDSGPAYVECATCGSHHGMDILNYRPSDPDEALRVLAHRNLLNGTSLGMVESKLTEQGWTAQRAEETTRDLCKGKIKRCSCGRRYHFIVSRCEECNLTLP